MSKLLSRSSLVVLLLSLAAFGLTACGDDDPTGPDDISPEKAAQVSQAVNEALGMTFGLFDPTFNTVPADVSAETISFDETVSCPVSGSVTATGSLTTTEVDATTTDFGWQTDASYSDCGVDVDGATFVLNTSSPFSVDGSGTVVVDDTDGSLSTYDFSWTYSGDVDWSEEGAGSGSCSMNLTGALTYDDASETFTGSVTGSSCGHSVDEEYSFGSGSL